MSMMTYLRQQLTKILSPLLLLAATACGNKTAMAPSPTSYKWPARFAYKLDYVSDAQANGRVLLHFAESRIARFAIREDESYLVQHDSVLKTSNVPGGPLQVVSYAPEDTLAWFLKLGSLGELVDVELGCDPDVAQCKAALPSSLPLELRHVIPRLSEWPVPRGSDWVDTLRYNDGGRPGGTRGVVITTYRVTGDTLVGMASYWMIAWRAVHRTWVPTAAAAIVEEPEFTEDGITFVDKAKLMPIYSAWAGTALASATLRAAGATASGFRGRAYLAGSVFDSTFSRR